jgi:hypothetical protein
MDSPVTRDGIRVGVDWALVGRPGRDPADTGRYQQVLTAALAAAADPGDEVWALISWSHAADLIGPGIGHAGVGRRSGDRAAMLRSLAADAAVFAQLAPSHVPVPAAVVMHDVAAITHPDWLAPDERHRTRARTEATLRRAAVVIAPSRVARIDVLSVADLPEEQVVVVPPAPAPVFGVRPGSESRVAARFGLDRYCVALGDSAPRGNLGHLADAVSRTGSGLTVVSPLSPPRRGRIRDGVVFVGPLSDDDRADLLAAARFAACVAFVDGSGLGTLEALACGVPVLVSDRGALSEVAGGAAIVVPPTVNAIAEGIRALDDPTVGDRLRSDGPARAAAYGAEGTGRAAWRALANLADRRPGAGGD